MQITKIVLLLLATAQAVKLEQKEVAEAVTDANTLMDADANVLAT